MVKKQYKIGAVGAGNMGLKHVHALVESDRWDLAYVCDLSDEQLKRAAELAPNAKMEKDFQTLLQDVSLDAVSLNTLSNIRPTMIQQAIAAGKHVICEKPLAPTAAQAKQLLDEIKGTDRLVTTNLFNRNAPYLREAIKLIQDGQIGKLAIIRVNHLTPGFPLERRLNNSHYAVEGHILHDCGMHYVDVMRWFAQSEYRDFTARALRFWEYPFECYFMVNGSFENNIAFELHNSFCYGSLAKDRCNHSGFEFIGTHGVIRIEHDFKTVTMRVNGREMTIEKEMPYGGKKLDIYYREFATALDNGILGWLPRIDDAVIASDQAQQMVDAALAGTIPVFGSKSDLTNAP